MGGHPGMKCVGDWRCFFLPYSLSITRFQLADFSFNVIQGRDVVQRFFGDLALVGRVQVEELAACMPKRASVPKPELTKDHVQTLEKILAESGSLRDRALLACMLGNLRQNEFLSARIQGGYEWRRHKVLQAQPNGAHLAIAELAKHVPKLTVVTQNVDDLHERAGSRDVIHLHGSLHSPRCIDCGLAYTLPLTSEALPEGGSRIEPPRCNVCDGHVRPGVVWFGEMLPEDAWTAGLAAAEECDVFLSIGTSGIVYPAAELPLHALRHRATVVHINPVRFDVSSQEHFFQGSASVMMQSLLRDAFGSHPVS